MILIPFHNALSGIQLYNNFATLISHFQKHLFFLIKINQNYHVRIDDVYQLAFLNCHVRGLFFSPKNIRNKSFNIYIIYFLCLNFNPQGLFIISILLGGGATAHASDDLLTNTLQVNII